MRNYKKRQLEKLLENIRQTSGCIRELASSERTQCINLLADLQDAAIVVGESIEQSEGEGTRAVELLEEYCEVLYQIGQTADASIEEDCQHLDVLLEQVQEELCEMKVTYEVVFLPYKASMWDCMESVWMAAKEDDCCNSYVIPIPYFDRKEDGTIGTMHCEEDLFPDYVPITSYESYNLEENRPDIIFIHNPYDAGNRVTSVHPMYYSSVLKNYTDMLVYIPYYITNGHLPETHKLLPAYAHVDKIILQSEVMLDEIAEEIPRDKLLVMGSPKADRILRLQRQRKELIKHTIPKSWRKKIQGKKVILYNVSISGILENSKVAMNKIRYVLSRFENRDDVVLLWRPHPLLEATLQSMRPGMYEEYLEIKKVFLQKDYGILDETGDVVISTVVADAYIGEGTSSIVNYFGVQGKPVYITDWRITKERTFEERASLFFTDCYFEEDYAWFVPRSELFYNYLCRMNLNTGKMEQVAKLPGEIKNPAKGNAYFGIMKKGNMVILSPVWSSDIYIYNLDSGQAVKLPLECSDRAPAFLQVHLYKENVLLQPRNYPALVKVDLLRKELVYYKDVLQTQDITSLSEKKVGYGGAVDGNKMYLPCESASEILECNMETGTIRCIAVGEEQGGFHALVVDGADMWLVREGKAEIIHMDMDTKEIQRYNEFPNGFYGGKQPFKQMVVTDEWILVVPQTANMLLRIDKISKEVTKFDCSVMGSEGDTTNICYHMVKKYGHKLIMVLTENGQSCMVSYDLRKKHATKAALQFSTNIVRKEEENICKKFGNANLPWCWMENTNCSLSVFIGYFMNADSDIGAVETNIFEEFSDRETTFGSMIYSNIMKIGIKDEK